jgi:hypothetical protein
MFNPKPKSYARMLWSHLIAGGGALRQRLTSAIAVSWWVWVAAVLIYAYWSVRTYQPPGEPRWLGLTIHVTAFAAVAMLVRAWFVINFLPE